MNPIEYGIRALQGEKKKPYTPSKVIQSNIDLLTSREQVGTVKYGVTLDNAGLSIRQLLRHLLEEQLDASNYTQAMLQQLENQKTFEDGLAERDHLLKVLQRELRLPDRAVKMALYLYQADAALRGVHK